MITADLRPSAAAPWMHIATALLGESEIAGNAHNPRIVELFRVGGTPQFTTDETAWCAAKVNGCLALSGYAGTRSALASSFASFGADLGNRPVYGAVVLFYPLAAGSSGHVGFFVKDNGDGTIEVISGNDSNAVRQRSYPKDKVRAYRFPTVKGPLPAETTLPTILMLAPQDAPDHVRPGLVRPPAKPVLTVTPADNFQRVHPLIAKWEGTEFTNHPRDKGGPTKFGITQQRLSEERGAPVSADDVAALRYEEALSIFRRRYWAPLRCDEMPIALAIVTYNAGVNSGPARGGRFLQMALNRQGHGLDEDGDVGPKTLTAANTCRDIAQAVKDYAVIYESYYRGLDDFDVWGRGWLNRLDDIKSKALTLAQEKPTVPDQQTTSSPNQTIDLDLLAEKIAVAVATPIANALVVALRNSGFLPGGQQLISGSGGGGTQPQPQPQLQPQPQPQPQAQPPSQPTPKQGALVGLLGGLAAIVAQMLGAGLPASQVAGPAAEVATSAGNVITLLSAVAPGLGWMGAFNPIIQAFGRAFGGERK